MTFWALFGNICFIRSGLIWYFTITSSCFCFLQASEGSQIDITNFAVLSSDAFVSGLETRIEDCKLNKSL